VLNRRRILGDIAEATNLPIYSEGSHTPSPGRFSAWIKMDIPIAGNHPHRATTMVTADSTISEEHAAEKAADKEIKLIVKNGNIIVHDVNYDSLRDNTMKLRCAGLAACHNDAHLTRIACENNRLLQEREHLLTHLAYACTSFDDVLPIEVVQTPAIPGDLSTGTLRYTGNMPPSNRLEHLASFIVHSIIGPEYTRIRPRTGMDELD
jgi:hypothetical protein